MDQIVGQKAYRLFVSRRRRFGRSSNERATIEQSVEVLGRCGRTRSRGLQRRIFTSDEGSPHLERHRRFADGSRALGPCENRKYSEISRSQNKGRPDRGLSGLRHLTLAVTALPTERRAD